MAIISNVKPTMGEYEVKIEKRPKPILFFRVIIGHEKKFKQLRTMNDIKL
jgi:hypothetical protein